jgi:hypothetical protein
MVLTCFRDARQRLQQKDAIASGTETHTAPATAYDVGYCHGMVQGVIYFSTSDCAPEGVSIKQDLRVVVKYLEDHPEKLHLHAAQLVMEALAKAFPCKK